MGIHMVETDKQDELVEVAVDSWAGELLSVEEADEMGVWLRMSSEDAHEGGVDTVVVHCGDYRVGVLRDDDFYREILAELRHADTLLMTEAVRSRAPDGSWQLHIRTLRRARLASRRVHNRLHVGCLDVLTDAITGTAYRRHSRPWVSACLRDHRRSTGSRSGSRNHAIRSAPGLVMFGASASSRPTTFSSFPASLSSDAASHWRRSPLSYHTARQRPPSPRAGYTVTPHGSTITPPSPRVSSRPVPPAKTLWRTGLAALPDRPGALAARLRGRCGISVGILVWTSVSYVIRVTLLLRLCR
jgi:hypothetical protein